MCIWACVYSAKWTLDKIKYVLIWASLIPPKGLVFLFLLPGNMCSISCLTEFDKTIAEGFDNQRREYYLIFPTWYFIFLFVSSSKWTFVGVNVLFLCKAGFTTRSLVYLCTQCRSSYYWEQHWVGIRNELIFNIEDRGEESLMKRGKQTQWSSASQVTTNCGRLQIS